MKDLRAVLFTKEDEKETKVSDWTIQAGR